MHVPKEITTHDLDNMFTAINVSLWVNYLYVVRKVFHRKFKWAPYLAQGWQIDPMQLGFSCSFTGMKRGSYMYMYIIIQKYCTEKHVITTCQSHSALSMWVNLSSSNYEIIIAISPSHSFSFTVKPWTWNPSWISHQMDTSLAFSSSGGLQTSCLWETEPENGQMNDIKVISWLLFSASEQLNNQLDFINEPFRKGYFSRLNWLNVTDPIQSLIQFDSSVPQIGSKAVHVVQLINHVCSTVIFHVITSTTKYRYW